MVVIKAPKRIYILQVLEGLRREKVSKFLPQDFSTLTSADTLQRIEEGHKEVHEHSQVEGDAAPERHVPGAPVQDGLSCKTVD